MRALCTLCPLECRYGAVDPTIDSGDSANARWKTETSRPREPKTPGRQPDCPDWGSREDRHLPNPPQMVLGSLPTRPRRLYKKRRQADRGQAENPSVACQRCCNRFRRLGTPTQDYQNAGDDRDHLRA